MATVWIKNFGDENYFWDEVKENSWVTLISDEQALKFVLKNDEEGYRAYTKANLLTNKLRTPDAGTITRWWNDHFKLVNASIDDLWLFSGGDRLYWTKLVDLPIEYKTVPDPFPRGRKDVNVTLTIRKAQNWSDRDSKGRLLMFRELHPKTRDILRTQMTMARPNEDNANYARALINGEDLSPWFERPNWRKKLEEQSHAMAISADAWTKGFYNMAMSTEQTTKSSGQIRLSRIKEKNFGFSTRSELLATLEKLHKKQEGVCALTGIYYHPRTSVLAFENDYDPESILQSHWYQVSLDRIDSSRGYEKDNIQLTCWFANYWKGSQPNDTFLKLLNELIEQN